MLRRICGPKREEGTEHWRKLHNEELHNLYSSPNTIEDDHIKECEIGRACSTMGDKQTNC
jgi:hypothetical protein